MAALTPQQLEVGALLSLLSDLGSGRLASQYVGTLARHKPTGPTPLHLMLGKDPQATIAAALADIRAAGFVLVRNGEVVDANQRARVRPMYDLLAQTVKSFRETSQDPAMIDRIEALLPPPEPPQIPRAV